jgi:hypothetical protein
MSLTPAMSVFSAITAVGRLGADVLMDVLPAVFSGANATPQDSKPTLIFFEPNNGRL